MMVKGFIFAFLLLAAGCTDLKPLEAQIEDLQQQVNKLQTDLAKSASNAAAANKAMRRLLQRLPATRNRHWRSARQIPQPSINSMRRSNRMSRSSDSGIGRCAAAHPRGLGL